MRVTDEGAPEELAAAWYAKYGEDWHFVVRDQEFVDANQEAHSGAHVHRVEPAKVLVFGGEHGQTRFRF